MALATIRLFQPLTGAELKQILLDDFRKLLDGSTYFEPHLTFGLANTRISVEISSDPPLFAPIQLEKSREMAVEGAKLAENSQSVTLAGNNALGETPDLDRYEHQLPVTQPAPSETGQIVDREVKMHSQDLPPGRGRPKKITQEAVKKAVEVESATKGDSGEEIKVNKG